MEDVFVFHEQVGQVLNVAMIIKPYYTAAGVEDLPSQIINMLN